MQSNRSQPTLNDVAELAGVSSATVSRYFNNPKAVAKKSADRIRQAVLQTGYTPNLVAGTLASNKSRLVSIQIPQLYPSLFIETIEEIVNRLSESGLVATVGVTEFDIQRSNELVRAAMAYRAKAIITSAEISEEAKTLIRQSGTTTIEIWDLPDDPVDVAIGFSHRDIGRKLAQFVHSRGYARPHFITIDTPRAMRRKQAFEKQWKKYAGHPLTKGYLDIPPRFEHSRQAFDQILRLDAVPDVAICGSDWLAAGIIVQATSAGMKIPDDLAVIGFGNSTLAGQMRPTITSVDIEGGKIAQCVMEILDKRDRNEPLPSTIIRNHFHIVERESA